MIFDTHCHLNDEKLYPQIKDVIDRAKQIGVNKFLVVGWDYDSSILAIKISEEFEECYAAIGYHPSNIKNVTEEEYESLMKNVTHSKVIAIGEIGLDYYWDKDEKIRELQKQFFIKQIEFANKVKLPISIHARDAMEDTLKILKEHKPLYGGVVHCYSGSVENLKDILDLNLHIGLDGPLTFTNAKTPKAVCEEIPLEKLLVETDAPYLAPHPLRGTVNEPANLCWILDEISRIKQISKKHIMDVIYENSCKLFNVKR